MIEINKFYSLTLIWMNAKKFLEELKESLESFVIESRLDL